MVRLAAAFLALALAACGKPAPQAELVARVNGQGLTRAQLDARFARDAARVAGTGESAKPGMDQRVREAALRRLIDDAIVDQKAAELRVTVSQAQVEARYAEYRTRFATPQALAEYLERTRSTPEDIKDELRRALVEEGVAEKLGGAVQVSDDEVARAYEAQPARYQEKERVRASRVVVRVAEDAAQADRRAARARARALHAKASVQAADFAQLARSSSQGAEAASGGEMGWVEREAVGGEFDAVVFGLAPGAVSRVFRGRSGYEFVKVWEKLAARERSLEQVAAEIRAELAAKKRDERRRDALARVRQAARVEQLTTR